MCGALAFYDKVNWYLSSRSHALFAVDAVYDGASFMYAAEVVLILLLILGHPGSPIPVHLPMSLVAWLLIGTTAFTLIKLNLEFLQAQWKKLKQRIADAGTIGVEENWTEGFFSDWKEEIWSRINSLDAKSREDSPI